MTERRIDFVVGCHGAGKSTLIETVLRPVRPGVPVIDAEHIGRRKWGDEAEHRTYEAKQIADRTRWVHIEAGRPFIAELSLSQESALGEIDIARDAGFEVVVHSVMVPVDVAVERVRARATTGGMHIPESEIRRHCPEVWPLSSQAITRCDRAVVYDNTGPDMTVVARFVDGIEQDGAAWPDWSPIEHG